mgnify:CR=1 FL=1
MTTDSLLIPDWPAPANVRAVCSTRHGGVSSGPYASLNLGGHVGDDEAAVAENRQRFVKLSGMSAAPLWLEQVHGTVLATLPPTSQGTPVADACTSTERGVVCAVMTADCLPVLLCDQAGSRVAAVHAGWRGLCAGVIETAVAGFARSTPLMAYLGPAISQQAFEVGAEVREAFMAHSADAAVAFREGDDGRYYADLYHLARQRLMQSGVSQIYGGQYCTYRQNELFFSYRRDGQTGRMASAIWLD